MPGKIKLAIFFLIISLTVSMSYIYSDALYTRYLGFWYTTGKKMSAGDALSRAETMQRDFEKKIKPLTARDERKEIEEKHIHEMKEWLSRMVRVFGVDRTGEVTPAGKDLVMYTGFFEMHHGDKLKGASQILSAAGRTLAKDEIVPFSQAVGIFYEEKMYSDCVSILDRTDYPKTGEMLFIHGSSLYKLGKHARAGELFMQAEGKSFSTPEFALEQAKTLASTGKNEEALVYAKKALTLSPRSPEARKLTVTLLTKLGLLKEAEKVSRSGR